VPYYLGELTEKFLQDDKIQVLKASLVKLREFISFCEPLELVPQEEIETSLQGGTNVLADQRARKIARFKRQEQQSQSFLRSKNARNGVGVQLEQLHYLLLLMQERKIFQMMTERKRGRLVLNTALVINFLIFVFDEQI
ncbi:hypothetical protein V2J09_006430, partial [Rumex salicifolius]